MFSKLHAAAEAAGQHSAGHGRGAEEDDQHHQRTQQVIFSLAIPSHVKLFCTYSLVSPVAKKLLVSDFGGNKVDSGIGLSSRPARLNTLAGRYGNPMPESTLSPVRDL